MSTELEVLDCTSALRESRRAHVAPSGERRNLTAKSLYLGNRDVYRRVIVSLQIAPKNRRGRPFLDLAFQELASDSTTTCQGRVDSSLSPSLL